MMTQKNIGVELKSFITKDDHNRLLKFFEENSKFIEEDFQETHYFDCPGDVRIQRNSKEGKIILKNGKVHDTQREESEVLFPKEDFNKIKSIFFAAGLCTEIKWLRHRKEFDWKGIKVCLDSTEGYGYIVEIEKMASPENKDEVLWELEKNIKSLNIPLTSQEEFNEKFNYYKDNWRRLIPE